MPIGNRLKEAREKKAISLDEVHAKTKIHPRIIQILEEEKFEKLPSPLYAKGFLKNYAEFLEVNPDEILEAYEKQGKKQPEQILYLKTENEKLREGRGLHPFASSAALIAAAFLCGGAIFYGLTHYFHGWGRTAVRQAAAKSGLPDRHSKAETSAAKPSSEWLRSVEAGNFPKISPNHALHLKIKATDNVWLHITCDGKVLFQSILKKGVTESWSAAKIIQIWTGNPSSMSISVNNYSLGSPGKGSVKKMVLSHEGIRIVA